MRVCVSRILKFDAELSTIIFCSVMWFHFMACYDILWHCIPSEILVFRFISIFIILRQIFFFSFIAAISQDWISKSFFCMFIHYVERPPATSTLTCSWHIFEWNCFNSVGFFILFHWLPVCPSICICVCLSVYLSVRPPICLCVCVSVSVRLSVCLFVFRSVSIFVYLSAYLCVCPSVYVPARLSIYMPVWLSIFMSLCLFVCLSLWLSIYPSMRCCVCCLHACLFVCLCFFHSDRSTFLWWERERVS